MILEDEEEDEGMEMNVFDGVFNYVNYVNKLNYIFGNLMWFNRRFGYKLNLYRKFNYFKFVELWSGFKRNNVVEWRNWINDVEK